MCLSVGLGWVGEKSVWGGERAGVRGGFKLSIRGRVELEGRTMISSRELGFLFTRQGEPEIPPVNLYPKCRYRLKWI